MPLLKRDNGTQVIQLQLIQVRVLLALANNDRLTRSGICSEAGFSDGSGTLSYALNGKKQSASNKTPFPGLLEMELISKEELDIDGLTEVNYEITEKGKKALAEYSGRLPDVKSKELSTNNRYIQTE